MDSQNSSEKETDFKNAINKLNQDILLSLQKIKDEYPLSGITISLSNHETNPVGLNIDIDSDAYKVYVKGMCL